jgi:nitroreductase
MSRLEKAAVTSHPVHDLIRDRWSPRAFAPTPVSQHDLTAVLEAARWAASSNNGQPWRFIVATSDNASAHAAAADCFNPRNQRWARPAPVLIFICARKTFEANNNPNPHAWYDAGAAVAQLSLQAQALGLVVHQAAGIDRDKVRVTYNVPEEFDVVIGIALGHQGDADALPEELPGREREPRARKPLSDLVFAGKFGEAAKLG